MTRKKLILTDLLFVISVALIAYATDGFKKGFLLVFMMMMFAFGTCVKRHADYYKLTKKFY